MNEIEISRLGLNLGLRLNDYFYFSKFPSGEIKVEFDRNRLKKEFHREFYWEISKINSDELIKMYLVSQELHNFFLPVVLPCNLFVPYLPYSRQDRETAGSEDNRICINTLKYFSRLINNIGFKSVYTLDAHSDKSREYIEDLVSVNGYDILPHDMKDYSVLIIPDKGAYARFHESRFYNPDGFSDFFIVDANKKRCEKTGAIQIEIANPGYLINCTSPILVVDDICDGGATFLLLAKELRKHTQAKLHLHVTHGIFSKGKEELQKYYDKITYINEVTQ